MQLLRVQNKRISRYAPFGYDLDPAGEQLIENPTERGHIETMKALRAAGHSLWKIAAYLEQNDVPTKRGARWSATSVRAILNREAKLAA